MTLKEIKNFFITKKQQHYSANYLLVATLLAFIAGASTLYIQFKVMQNDKKAATFEHLDDLFNKTYGILNDQQKELAKRSSSNFFKEAKLKSGTRNLFYSGSRDLMADIKGCIDIGACDQHATKKYVCSKKIITHMANVGVFYSLVFPQIDIPKDLQLEPLVLNKEREFVNLTDSLNFLSEILSVKYEDIISLNIDHVCNQYRDIKVDQKLIAMNQRDIFSTAEETALLINLAQATQ